LVQLGFDFFAFVFVHLVISYFAKILS
jgi:hypothetical protein